MRIALVTNHVREARLSMVRFLALLREELLALGYDVRVYAPEPTPLAAHVSPRVRSLTDKLAFQARLARNDADVVHVLDQGDAGYVGFAGRAKTVVTCHDVSVLDDPAFLGPPLTSGWAYRKLLLARMRRGLRRADALVCDSDFTLADVDRLVPRSGRQARVRRYLPLRFTPDVEAATLPAPLTDASRPFLFHVGSSGHRKNRIQLLEVLARLPERYQLALAGDAPDAAFHARGKALGVAERVVVVGRTNDALLGLLYARAHCLLFPSTFEGFGWPVLEAQACDCPVVTSSVTSLPEVAGDGALLAAPNDSERFVLHVESLANPERRRELIERGRANAQKFRAIEVGKEYARVYEDLVRGPKDGLSS